jgi:hypothetical protein
MGKSTRGVSSPSNAGKNNASHGTIKSAPGKKIEASESKEAPLGDISNAPPSKVDYLAPRVIQRNDEVLARAQSMKPIQLLADAIIAILESDDEMGDM